MAYRIQQTTIPAYIQLYELIKEDIIKGAYAYGDRLPSKRTISEESDISVITVAHAYELLIDEGYVLPKEKSGYFVIYRMSDFYNLENRSQGPEDKDIESYEEKKKPYIHGAGELSYSIFSKIMRRTLLDYGEKLMERTPNKGLIELRQELSRYLSRSVGINVDWNRIIIGAGAEYLYGLAAQLLDEKTVVAVEDPSYEKIQKVYEREQMSVECLKLGKDGILSSELKRTSAQILHVTPFHSYPSNVSASISKKYEYISWAYDGKYIIEDNYDSELTISQKMDSTLYSLSEDDNVIYINTFSRTIAPALRVGYMILPKHLMNLFEQKLGFYSCTVPAFEQYFLRELIRTGDYEKHINRVRRKLRSELKR